MKAKKFHYKCGVVETNIPWFPPDPLLMNKWKQAFFTTPGTEDFTFWLCGACMESMPTYDVDILVTGKIKDYRVLENILYEAMRIGFEKRQLIDIAWNNNYEKYLKKGKCNRRAICCEYFYKYGYCELETCSMQVDDIETIVIGNEITKDGEVLTPYDPNAINLCGDLWKIKFKSPSEKQILRFKDGVAYNYSPVIITKNTDFMDLIGWP